MGVEFFQVRLPRGWGAGLGGPAVAPALLPEDGRPHSASARRVCTLHCTFTSSPCLDISAPFNAPAPPKSETERPSTLKHHPATLRKQDVNDLCEAHPDVVILATSILSTAAVLRSLPVQRLRRNTLFVDVLSVKVGSGRRRRRIYGLEQACSSPKADEPFGLGSLGGALGRRRLGAGPTSPRGPPSRPTPTSHPLLTLSPRPSPSSCCSASSPQRWTSFAPTPCSAPTAGAAAGRASTSCMRPSGWARTPSGRHASRTSCG